MISSKFKKAIAVFFLLLIVQSVVVPVVSYALTGGPSAPEFSSFEPVDTTDMVNLASGQLVYNLPLLEVPGPEGGYPLSLSYHSGIKLDQEGSWVGLGWTLNPGAINRTVDGYADDSFDSKREVKDYWGGGETQTTAYSLGFNVPKTGISVSGTLAETRDTYRGFSSKPTFGVSIDPVNLAINQTSQLSNGVGTPRWANNLNQANNAIGKAPGKSSMGFTISSDGLKPDVSVFGVSMSQKNHMAGKISSFTKVTNVGDMPIGPIGFFGIRKYYTRYWSDESSNLLTYGSLYPGAANNKLNTDFYSPDRRSGLTAYAFDSYDMYIHNDIEGEINLVDDPNDPAKQVGGSFPAFDGYEILGQGIGGSIKPFIFENGDMFGQNLYHRGNLGYPALTYPILKYNSLKKFSTRKVDFRFVNDFSNSLTMGNINLQENENGPFVGQPSLNALPEGFKFDEASQRLAGSRHVEWFSNEEIVNGAAFSKGFIDCYANRAERKLDFDVYDDYLQPEAGLPHDGYKTHGRGQGSFKGDSYDDNIFADLQHLHYQSLRPKATDLRKKIGGFMATNETGVTYHYAQPVYSYNEYQRQKLKTPIKGAATFREYKNNDPYAYTWLLTAITGPDYVDSNSNGLLDDDDLGYWVKFDYGKWADSYQWRSPHSGYQDDVESEYATFRYGIKELYYLDAIETRSHKAIFIKSKRKDSRGVTSRLEGGSNPRIFNMRYKFAKFDPNPTGHLKYQVSPVSTMKLDAIHLFKKSDLAQVPITKSTGERYNEAPASNPNEYGYDGPDYYFEVQYSNPLRSVTIDETDKVKVSYHNPDLVFDDDDVLASGLSDAFTSKSQRIIKFGTDYSLAPGVPNSFESYGNQVLTVQPRCEMQGPECASVDERIGQDFEFPGEDCVNAQAPTFISCCELNGLFYSEEFLLPQVASCLGEGNYLGANVPYPRTGKLTLKDLTFLGRGGADLIPPTTFAYSAHNPEYDKDSYDEWGFYKSDFEFPNHEEPISLRQGSSRKVTTASSAHTDAWSLTEIGSPLGSKIKIGYAPNDYESSVYNNFTLFSVTKIEPVENVADQVKVTFKEVGDELSKWFRVNEPVDLSAFILHTYTPYNFLEDAFFKTDQNDRIAEVGADFLKINSPTMLAAISTQDVPNDNVSFTIPYFLSGYVKVDDALMMSGQGPAIKYIGGIRVNTIDIVDENAVLRSRLSYGYKRPGSEISSGITSYKPYAVPSVYFPVGDSYFDFMFTLDQNREKKKELEKLKVRWDASVNKEIKDIMEFTREAPAPGALYEYVTVKTGINTEADSYEIYHFTPFSKLMIYREAVDGHPPILKNLSNDIGQLISVNTYNKQGAPVKSKTINYLYDSNVEPHEVALIEQKQGIVDQTFHKSISLREYKVDLNLNNGFETTFGGGEAPQVDIIYSADKHVISRRQDRINVVTGVEEHDYINGLTSKQQNWAFDFYGGQVTEAVSFDSYGSKILNRTVPAYHRYPAMGLRISDLSNKNMLTQSAEQYSFLLDNTTNQPSAILSGSIQTWSNTIPTLAAPPGTTKIFRKKTEYAWQSNEPLNAKGVVNISELNAHPFNWSDPDDQPNWPAVSEITLYDSYSKSHEAKDVDGNYASMRMDEKFRYVISQSVNASYHESAYSGAEDYSGTGQAEGGVDKTQGLLSNAYSHTGTRSLLVASGKSGFGYTLNSSTAKLDKKYKASVWVYAPGNSETQSQLDNIELYYEANGNVVSVHPVLQKKKSKSWYLLELYIDPAGANTATIGTRNNSARGVYFDDFRVHPLNAAMTTYVYDQSTDEVNYILDGNNFYTKFEYDAMGRLVRTSRELLNYDFGNGKESLRPDAILGEYKYHNGNQ